jgi:adenylate cyclase
VSDNSQRSRFPLRFSWIFTLLFLVAYCPSFVLLPVNGLFFQMENVWHDHLFSAHGDSRPKGDPRLILVAMDEDTGKKYGFPLPRDVHARVLDALKKYGAKVTVFDVLFMEKREHDAELAAATRRFGRAIHLYNLDNLYSKVGVVRTTSLPIEPLVKASWGLGFPNVDTAQDRDGHVRRTMLFDPAVPDPRHPNEPSASVNVVAYAALTDQPLDEVKRRWGTPPTRHYVLNFRAPQEWPIHPIRAERAKASGAKMAMTDIAEVSAPYRRVSVLDLIDGTLTAEQKQALKGSLAIVGSTTLGYYDHYPTPFNTQGPGPEYLLNVIDNMLHADFLRNFARGWFVLVIIAMIWLPLLLQSIPPVWGAATTGGVLIAWWAFGYWGFAHNLYVEFMAPSAALLSAFLAQTVHRVLAEGREKKRIKSLFGQFVAPEVVDDLARNPEKARLGGEKKEMTMLFLDIAHFTTISEKMPPEALIVFLNKYLSALSQVILDEKAVVGNYIGDCIMAFWNAPILPVDDHRARACLAALECQAMMAKLNETLDPLLPMKPAIRIGLNSGHVTVGLTGSEKKLQYTVLGDEVNLSSRLEGANKFFGSAIMVSEATYQGATGVVEARELGRVKVVGKDTPIRVFELLAKKGQLSPEWSKALGHYNDGLAKFVKRQYDQAAVAFAEVVKIIPDDGPAGYYLSTARDYAAIPPDEKWDGVVQLTAK